MNTELSLSTLPGTLENQTQGRTLMLQESLRHFKRLHGHGADLKYSFLQEHLLLVLERAE